MTSRRRYVPLVGALLAQSLVAATGKADGAPPGDSGARVASILGGALLGITYLQAVVVGTAFVAIEAGDAARREQTTSEDELGAADYTPLYIPAAGPFITIATTGAEGGDARLLVANGVAQVVGLGVLTTGLIMLALADDGETSASITPTVSPHAAAVSVGGRF